MTRASALELMGAFSDLRTPLPRGEGQLPSILRGRRIVEDAEDFMAEVVAERRAGVAEGGCGSGFENPRPRVYFFLFSSGLGGLWGR